MMPARRKKRIWSGNIFPSLLSVIFSAIHLASGNICAVPAYCYVVFEEQDRVAPQEHKGKFGIIVETGGFNVKVYAGIRYRLILQHTVPDGTVNQNTKFAFAVVEGVGADDVDCSKVAGPELVKGSFPTGVDGNYQVVGNGFEITAAEDIEFRTGGAFRICISVNGKEFASPPARVVHVNIVVKGVYDKGLGYRDQKIYNCYLRRKAYYGHNSYDGRYNSNDTSCRVWWGNHEPDGLLGYPRTGEKATWSAEFELDPISRNVVRTRCGTLEPADFICNVPDNLEVAGACGVGTRFVNALKKEERTLRIPTVVKKLEGREFRARTVAACYCPGYHSCDEFSDFVQQIGILHFWLSKVCDPGVPGCPDDYSGVTPQYRFKIVIQCPTDACKSRDGTKLKIVEKHRDNDLPSWMPNSGCRFAEHGILTLRSDRKHFALHDNPYGGISPYVPFAAPKGTPQPTNPECDSIHGCPESKYGQLKDDNNDQDYIEFGGESGFQFFMANTNHEARNFYNEFNLDVCYCNGDCHEQANWFKAGAMRLSPTRLLSSATESSNLPSQWCIEFVNQPGIIGIYASYDDEHTLGLSEKGMLIKVIEDMPDPENPAPANADFKCQQSGYDGILIAGPGDAGAASFNYAGAVVSPEATRIIFNSGFVARSIKVNRAGRIAICYCARVDDSGLCKDGGDRSMSWRNVASMTIKGPKTLPQQRWRFSTNIVFRFSYSGYGFMPQDKVRIIDFSGKCTDDNFNPDRAAHDFTYVRVGCPLNCQKVTSTDDEVPGDLTTRTRTSDCWSFNRINGGCVRNDIETVTVLSDSETELQFQNPHGFLDDDEISLHENFHCNTTMEDNPCTDEAVDALRGVYYFQDTDNNDYQAPSTYMRPHRIRTVPGNPRLARIQLGWPEPRPVFEVIFTGTDPNRPAIIGEGGQWKHHTESFTVEEIVGEKAKANMKVCWSFFRPEAPSVVKYVAEVGLLTVTDPAVMEGATISISTMKLGQAAPMIIQFQTAPSEQIGMKYDQAVDSIRLKIIFTRPEKLDIHKSGLDAPELPYDEFVEADQASQQACGQIFLEFWSEDMERGFPLPKGCHYRSFAGTTKRREIEIIFEPKNGLRKNTLYQVVFNAHIQDVLVPITHELKEEYFAQIIPMDDVTLRPYEAIERGEVRLLPDGRIPKPARASDESAPEFSPTSGFKILGGYNNLLELQPGDTLAFELMGGINRGTMMGAGNRLRIFLLPLTQWMTTSSCTASCITGGENSFQCDYIKCEAEAMVPGMPLNILKLTFGYLDAGWTGFGQLYNTYKVRVRVGAITMPPGGFFAQRFAAQITDAGMYSASDVGDKTPDYTISVGDLVWKAPTEGQTVAKVISVGGGANSRPFRMQDDNILYARLILAATIFARDNSREDASFEIILPPDYECKLPDPDVFINDWAAEDDLPAFDGVMPQGRGTPDDKQPYHGWSTDGRICKYTPFHPYGIIYAGSSLVVKIKANNPKKALPRGISENKWTFRASSRGLCGKDHCIKQGEDREFMFLSSPDPNYQSNNVVLGIIEQSSIQPSNFHLRGARDGPQALRVFFATEQEVAGGGAVLLRAPSDFDFGDPCVAGHLENSYYASAGDPEKATLRLPVDNSKPMECTTYFRKPRDGQVPYQEIEIRLRDILEGGRYFGFRAEVNNPAEADQYSHVGWRIHTADSQGYLVDGTPFTVPFIESDNKSWGVHGSNLTGLAVSAKVEGQTNLMVNGKPVVDMRPYSMSQLAVYLIITMKNVPAGDSGEIRVVLPDTYKWNFDRPLVFHFPDSSLFPPCAGVASGGTCHTMVDDRLITFPPGNFKSDLTYAFKAPIQVPDANPAVGSNAVFVELGYNSRYVSDRKGAASIELPSVRALKNAHVDYTTSIVGKETALQFSIQTSTEIPSGGFLQIEAPTGFAFSDDCYLIQSADPGAETFPRLSCEHKLTQKGPRIRLKVKVGDTLEARTHKFAMLAENPRMQTRNGLSDSACGTDICWLFRSFEKEPDPDVDSVNGVSMAEELDKDTSARSYNINARMLEARIPLVTDLQMYATGRDDRPAQQNNVIFAFQLSTPVLTDGEIQLRAPHGFVFAQECSDGIVTDEATIFGLGNRFPDEFTVWPKDVVIRSCRGNERDALLNFTVAPSNRLEASKLYIIRVGNFRNPWATPDSNRWTIEVISPFFGEASEPIEGMPLWTFAEPMLEPVATARDQTLAGEIRTENPLRVRFRPFNTIPQEGELRMMAPTGFVFSHRESRECEVLLRELPYTDMGVQYPGYIWPKIKLVCLANEGDSAKVSVRLRDERPVQKGLAYELIVFAFNSETQSTYAADWTLQSWLPGNRPLDESRIPGFVVNNVMSFTYNNEDPSKPGHEVRNGKVSMPAFSLEMQFPDALTEGDKVVIVVPMDFEFTKDGACWNFRWECDRDMLRSGEDCPAPLKDQPTCNSKEQTITFEFWGNPPVQPETKIWFGITMRNPSRTMPKEDNLWQCTHYSNPQLKEPRGRRYREDKTERWRTIYSSKSFMSWDIVPQMENVLVEIIRPGNLAAGSRSAMFIQFRAVNDAEDVSILFMKPPEFDFGGAYLEETHPPQKLMIPDTQGPLARIRTTIIGGTEVQIRLFNVRFGSDGGQTKVRLESWVGGMLQNGIWNPGDKKDERMECENRCGFVLPGALNIAYEKLENQFHKSPLLYPVQSRWEAQMGRPAKIKFRFSISQPAKIGHEFWIYGKPYQPTMQDFTLAETKPTVLAGQEDLDDPASRIIKNKLKDVMDRTLKVELEQALAQHTSYEVVLSVIAPTPEEERDFGLPIQWTLETWAVPYGNLPTNTNDGKSREFPIVEEYKFEVVSPRASPIASIDIGLIIKPGIKAPTMLVVVAPLLYTFPTDCLVNGAGIVRTCSQSTPMPDGRRTAALAIDEPGLTSEPKNLVIKVQTPAKAPLAKAWFIEGRDAWTDEQYGWGEAEGIEIEQMAETSVTYPGIPAIEALMVFRFRTQVLIESGGWLQLSLPEGFAPVCKLRPVALPRTASCRVENPQTVLVLLNSTLVPGEYSFGIVVTPPAEQPLRNEFTIILRDRFGNVRDAAVDMPGLTVQEKLKIQATPLAWTNSKPLRATTITIGFEAVEPLPDLIVAPIQQVSEILITLPVGCSHMVEEVYDFTVINEQMPFKEGQWLDFMQKDRLRVILELNRTSWTTLKPGKYEFRFQVLLPAVLPMFNVWYIGLCSPNYLEGCNRIDDPAVLLTFPMPGFEFGDGHGGQANNGRSAEMRLHLGVYLASLSLLCLVWRPSD